VGSALAHFHVFRNACSSPIYLCSFVVVSRVLTSGNHGVGHLERKPPDTPEHLKYEQETTLAQARWLELSSNSKQIFARNSSEYIQFDEPETVINAIREVYDQTRRPPAAQPDQK
jgi:hypothetical protein